MLHEIPCSFILWECKMYPGHQKCWSMFVGLNFRHGRWLLNVLLLRPESWGNSCGLPRGGGCGTQSSPPPIFVISPLFRNISFMDRHPKLQSKVMLPLLVLLIVGRKSIVANQVSRTQRVCFSYQYTLALVHQLCAVTLFRDRWKFLEKDWPPPGTCCSPSLESRLEMVVAVCSSWRKVVLASLKLAPELNSTFKLLEINKVGAFILRGLCK